MKGDFVCMASTTSSADVKRTRCTAAWNGSLARTTDFSGVRVSRAIAPMTRKKLTTK